MATINSKYCVDGNSESINFNGNSYSVGTFLTATESPPAIDIINYCFEITDSADEPTGTFTATTNTFNSCYDCLVNNFTIVSLVACDDESITLVFPISAFGYIPIIDQVIYAEIEFNDRGDFTTYTKCFKVIEVIQVSENGYVTDYEPNFSNLNQIIFNNFSIENGCNECLFGFSAGTESTICVVCCPCTTGETISSVSAPHPTWTNGQGQAVIQLNAITLGGPNGLNN
jgi:hypothetical protein